MRGLDSEMSTDDERFRLKCLQMRGLEMMKGLDVERA